MNSERRQRVERLYRSALEHEPARRGAFLAEACEGDEELRSEVESLLSHEESAGVVIEPPSAEGRTISQYRILEKIGEGGMGRVYKARDLKLDRPVALKFLAPRLLASAHARSRFLLEARALSALNHPHIATIFDVEETESEPFLVLEYLPGGTLQSKMRRLAADGRKLSASQILEYGMQIAEGLAHAHRHGIVHRDVKTGNVLLSAEGSLKITDFGLARFRGGEHVTRPGSMLGTAAYMSPEQARGREVDHRSDIFSFGIVLYEIAAAELPFKGDHEQAVVHQILNESPRPLHEVRPDLPRGFEALVERALQKDPERRYQRMEQVLEELSRLRREADTGGDAVSRRFTVTLPQSVRRRGTSIRWLVAAALLLAALVSAVMVLPGVRRTLLQLVPYFQAQKERHLAVLPFANVGGDPENQAFCDGVVESLTSSLTQLERFQGSLLVVPASEVRRQSVASVRDAQRSFGVNLAVTGSVQRTAGGVRLTVNLNDARTLRQLGARAVDVPREELSKMEDRLLNLVAELLEMQLQPQARSALSAGSTSVSDAYDAYLQGRGYLQRYDKPGNVERAVSVFQEALKRDPHYALAYAGLGEAYLRSFGRDKDPHWLELAQGAGARAVELNRQLAPAHVNLGMVYAATGRLEKAVGEFKIALDLDPISVAAYRELAGAYEAQNKMKDAEDTYKRAIQLRPGDWVSNGLLGTFFYRHGRYTEAEPLFRKIIELTPDNFNGYLNLGGLYTALGRYEEAEPLLKKSNEVRPTYRAYSNLGTLYYQRGRYPEAVSMYEKAVELGAGADHRVLGNLADSYRWAPGLAEKAPPAYRRAIELAEQQLAINPKDATVLSRLAAYRAEVGEKDKALSDIRRARKLAPADNSVGFRAVLVYELAGRRDDALAALEEILKGGYALEQVEREPELEKMRQDPRYSGIKSRYGAGNSNTRSK